MKKFMKGLLATTMVFAMMTSLAGCGGCEWFVKSRWS